MTSQIDKSSNSIWKEKEANMSNTTSLKSVKRLKSPKKFQECKNLVNDKKIEDVFLNSEYFKHQTGSYSSLNFCSGDNGENQWTIEKSFEFPQKANKRDPYTTEAVKNDKAVQEKGKLSKTWQQKLKIQNCNPSEIPPEETNKFLEGILTGKGRLDRDLITLITEQMFLAERELQVTRTHLVETASKLNERDLEILQLHEEIQNLQARKNMDDGTEKDRWKESSLTKTSEDYQRLIVASEKLKKQVKDMEDFLNDYGLVWVGDKVTNQKPDFDKVLKNFQRLNSIANEPKIIQTTMGAKFEVPHEIPVVLYSNGLLLRNKDFREYDAMSTSLFLKDVEDGYFPSELQLEFPEGVPFEVTDKRSEVYTPNNKTRIFQGPGNRLGSLNEGKPSSVVYLEPLKEIRNHDPHPSLGLDSTDRCLLKKIHKKKPKIAFSEEDSMTFETDTTEQRLAVDTPKKETEYGQKLKVKIRFGMEKMELFVMQVAENDKMFSFQEVLQRKLCERYHDECVKTSEMNNTNTDLEIHIYGRSPFRLSDHLNQYPVECGIVNNCVINVTEI